jgi:tetratricopeptide (TPR) repeat protein
MSEAYQYYQKGLAALAAGHADEAIVPLERAKKLEPESSSIREALGKTYFKLHFYDRAITEFTTILQVEPLDDYAHFCIGRCYDKVGNIPMAQRHYKLALSLKPSRDVYRNTLDRFLERTQDRDTVMDGISEPLAQDADDWPWES